MIMHTHMHSLQGCASIKVIDHRARPNYSTLRAKIDQFKDHISESTIKLLTLIFVITTCAAAVSAQSDTCRACNCQFNNVQVLDQLIEDGIATALENGAGE